jgi:hypothetical protein
MPPAGSGAKPAQAAIRLRFVGAEPGAPAGEVPRPGRSHYFSGGPDAGIVAAVTDIPHYGRVRVAGLYPGIDLVYRGSGGVFEYDFELDPHADPASIRIRIEGATGWQIEPDGGLAVATPAGSITQRRPEIYQWIAGARQPVDGRFTRRGPDLVGFEVEEYDAAVPLIIDPVLSYGSHSGGFSATTGIAVDDAGNAYVTGSVLQGQSALPIVSAYDSSIGHGDTDAFVQKFNAAGTALLYSTYLGGPKSTDRAVGIAIDAAGNAYVTGNTTGPDFPVSATAYQKAPASGGGAFVAKLGPAGNALLFSTYLLNVSTAGIAVDGGGNAVVAGGATPALATTPGALQAVARSAATGFVLKLNAAATAPLFSTFLGGSGTDEVRAVALDGAGNIYVAGGTTSSDFPVVNAFQPAPGGGRDAFVARLNAAGNALGYATFLGGNQDDVANALAVDAAGSAYVTGATTSFDFPVWNAFQTAKGGAGITGSVDNAFVTRLDPAGTGLVYSSFLGGNGCIGGGMTFCFISRPVDTGTSIAVDAQGHAFVGGQTKSMAFPLVDSLQAPVPSNGDAAFVTKVSSLGGTLLFSTLLGGQVANGNPADYVTGMAVDRSGNAYGTGAIANFPATPGPLQSAGGAIVFKIAAGNATLALASSANPATSGQPVTLSTTATGVAAGASVQFMAGPALLGSAPVVNGIAALTTMLPPGIHGVSAIVRDAGTETESPVLFQVVQPATRCG